MYNKILVPLDGSQFSACSLQHVKAIAIGCHVPEVVLFRAVQPLSSNELSALAQMGEAPIEQIEAKAKSEAANYISGMVQELNKDGIVAVGKIVSGKADEQILEYAKNNHFDLIIMSTHGRSGVTRWAFGSVADRVVRYSIVPVLIVTPAECRSSQT